jgi:hypothetical protein
MKGNPNPPWRKGNPANPADWRIGPGARIYQSIKEPLRSVLDAADQLSSGHPLGFWL